MDQQVPWLSNVGEVIISDNDECFWMLPSAFFFKQKYCVTSPCFSVCKQKWRLVMMPSDGYTGPIRSGNRKALFLWKNGLSPPNFRYNVEMGIKETDGKQLFSFRGEILSDYGYGTWDFFNTEHPPYGAYSVYGRMKIFCIIRKKEVEDIPEDNLLKEEEDDVKSKDEVANEDEKDAVPEATGVDRLIQNFKNLLHDESSSDVILKTNGREFHAHSLILRARSPVFASMFQHDMTEKNSGVVDIPDCLAAAFEVFLLYLYTGTAGTMSCENVINLYYTADKYRVDDLKSECVEYMKNTLSVDTFCDVISLSLRHGESDLRKEATRFFCENVKKIVKTVQWQKYISENPIQANELYMKAINA